MYLTYLNTRIYYEVIGEGKPILMVHGWGGSSASMKPLAQLLATSHKLQAIIVDLPGFGQSSTPPPEWGTPEYADVLIALLSELNIRQTNYFGHSFGGSLGIYLATHTKLIDRLILCNSSYKRRVSKSMLVRIAKHILPGNNPPLKMLFYRIFFRNSDLARYPHIERNFRLIMKQDLTPLISKVHAPTLIIWGERDTITPIELGRELHNAINDSKFVIIPHARHGLPLRNPELLVEPITKFIA